MCSLRRVCARTWTTTRCAVINLPSRGKLNHYLEAASKLRRCMLARPYATRRSLARSFAPLLCSDASFPGVLAFLRSALYAIYRDFTSARRKLRGERSFAFSSSCGSRPPRFAVMARRPTLVNFSQGMMIKGPRRPESCVALHRAPGKFSTFNGVIHAVIDVVSPFFPQVF